MSNLPEIIFAGSNPSESRRIRNRLNNGQIRPLIPRVYTSNLEEPIDQIVRRNIWLLVSHLFPEAHISHRSAIEYRISPLDNLYLTAGTRRVYRWPGVSIRIAKGTGPLLDDGSYMYDLRISSLERACLENLSSSRRVEGEKRTVELEVIEERLLNILHTRGEAALNQLRDRARQIAEESNMEKSFEKLNAIIGSILSIRSMLGLTSPRASAQAIGEPYDSGRLELFSTLLAALKQTVFPERRDKSNSKEAFSNFAFSRPIFQTI